MCSIPLLMATVSALEFWLSSLDLSEYYPSFLDNGYDDLEICKKVIITVAPINYYLSIISDRAW